jgi:catechol 2,3-dioxygenase-like lactoylglutathione lyase family enzyme
MTKIGYVTIGAKDSDASVKFYDAVFQALGDERKFSEGGWTGYGVPGPDKGFTGCHTMLCKPHDGKEARGGNGIMISYLAQNPEAVNAAQAGGIANGGPDTGNAGAALAAIEKRLSELTPA